VVKIKREKDQKEVTLIDYQRRENLESKPLLKELVQKELKEIVKLS